MMDLKNVCLNLEESARKTKNVDTFFNNNPRNEIDIPSLLQFNNRVLPIFKSLRKVPQNYLACVHFFLFSNDNHEKMYTESKANCPEEKQNLLETLKKTPHWKRTLSETVFSKEVFLILEYIYSSGNAVLDADLKYTVFPETCFTALLNPRQTTHLMMIASLHQLLSQSPQYKKHYEYNEMVAWNAALFGVTHIFKARHLILSKENMVSLDRIFLTFPYYNMLTKLRTKDDILILDRIPKKPFTKYIFFVTGTGYMGSTETSTIGDVKITSPVIFETQMQQLQALFSDSTSKVSSKARKIEKILWSMKDIENELFLPSVPYSLDTYISVSIETRGLDIDSAESFVKKIYNDIWERTKQFIRFAAGLKKVLLAAEMWSEDDTEIRGPQIAVYSLLTSSDFRDRKDELNVKVYSPNRQRRKIESSQSSEGLRMRAITVPSMLISIEENSKKLERKN